MNAIQQYLFEVAQEAVRKAAGNMVRENHPDPLLVVESMNEFLEFIGQGSVEFKSKIPSNLTYSGGGTTRYSVLHEDYCPVFVDPAKKKVCLG